MRRSSSQSESRKFPRALLRRVCMLLGACSLVVSLCAFGQEYKEAQVDETLAGQKDSVLSGGDAKAVKDFMRKYYLARWTVRANAQNLVKFRQELETDATSRSGSAQQTLLKEAVDTLKSYAGSKDCYPACRFNAALAIGMLNEVAGDRSGSGATPYAGAITTLASMVNSTKEVPDYVRLAALIGLVRHAELGIKDEKMANSVKSLFAKILDPTYAEERGIRAEVYEWFQEKALMGLASYKSPAGAKGGSGTLELFKRILDDGERSYDLRCLAARAIGDMDLDSLNNYNYLDLSKSLVLLARDFCVDEMNYIDAELVRDVVKTAANQVGGGMTGGMGGGSGGMGSMGGMDMMGGGMGMSGGMGGGMSGTIQNAKSMEAIVARIQYGFDSIQRAIKGVKNGGSGVQAKLSDSDEAQKAMKETLTKALDEFAEMNTFIKEGPSSSGGMMDMGGSGMMSGMGTGSANVNVDANSLKDHLLEKKIKFNELLGIDSY